MPTGRKKKSDKSQNSGRKRQSVHKGDAPSRPPPHFRRSQVAQDPLSGPAALPGRRVFRRNPGENPYGREAKVRPRRRSRAGRAARLESEPCATFCSVGCATGPAGYARPLRLSAESRSKMRKNPDRAARSAPSRPAMAGTALAQESGAGPALRSCGTSRPAAVSTQVTGNRDRRAAKVRPAPEEARRKGRKAGER